MKRSKETPPCTQDIWMTYYERSIKYQIAEKLIEINNLHPSLKFTIERENDSSISFLDIHEHSTKK